MYTREEYYEKVTKLIYKLDKIEKVTKKEVEEALRILDYEIMECTSGLEELRFRKDYIKYKTGITSY